MIKKKISRKTGQKHPNWVANIYNWANVEKKIQKFDCEISWKLASLYQHSAGVEPELSMSKYGIFRKTS